MAQIRPFAGVHYSKQGKLDFSKVIAPPYDVLDEKDKAALQTRDPHNIVSVDLPWMPPKTVGPDEVYAKSAQTLEAWMKEGILQRDGRPAIYPYSQTYTHSGRTYHRRGFIALVKLSPFGVDVIPHEKTYDGPIEDRMKLMKFTGVQLSPIFGLFSDPRNEITNSLYKNLGRPEISATLDGVRNDLWSVNDADTENQVIMEMKRRPIYIADGHHRYTTALQYQKEMTEKNGGTLPPNHPANYCMFVLVSMQDDGLLILPTHRLIGGLDGFSVGGLQNALRGVADIKEMAIDPANINEFARQLAGDAPHTFGLFEGATRRCYTIHLTNTNILQKFEPTRSEAWRKLDVAILQRYLLDEVLQPQFGFGKELAKGYTADASVIPSKVDGKQYQIALLLKPTPLHALEELGKVGEVMPQKSTYFFPKLATGMILNPLT